MKKAFKLTMTLLIAVMTMTMGSCLSDGEDYSISKSDYRTYLLRMSSSYSGKLTFYKQRNNDYSTTNIVKYDSIPAFWEMSTDSLIRIDEFPINKLDSAIRIEKDATPARYKALAKAIKEYDGEVQLKCFYYIPSTQFVTSTQIGFVVNPLSLSVPLEYEGKTHNVFFNFIPNYYQGVWTQGRYSMAFDMCLQSIAIDEYTNIIEPSYVRPILIQAATR